MKCYDCGSELQFKRGGADSRVLPCYKCMQEQWERGNAIGIDEGRQEGYEREAGIDI